MCLLLQRYTFWSNSQPRWPSERHRSYCACYCKDTHFEAIHNSQDGSSNWNCIVLATAKIHILKQFTTDSSTDTWVLWLCLLLQRYTFWSNSQLITACSLLHMNCACYCKDTHFEAIHNRFPTRMHRVIIVLATAKIHILKQFTTKMLYPCLLHQLCLLLQWYTFWSNSQQFAHSFLPCFYCACYCKDTHFEAIHNIRLLTSWRVNIVLATAKIHILKQFTTRRSVICWTVTLCLLLQRYTFWSNSQQILNRMLNGDDCACYCKDTHFEAIHNARGIIATHVVIVLATAKIHILKQFTTTFV